MSDILRVTGLQKSFGGLMAVADVSFSVPRSKIVSIIGPNGAGKSTVFDLLTRVQDADAGSIVGDAGDLLNLPAHKIVRHGIARTFQQSQLIETASVRDNVGIGRLRFRSSRMSSAIFRTPRFRREQEREDARVDDVVKQMGLDPYRDDPISTTSTLVRQMTSIAMAVASEPQLLLLDEPMGGLVESEVQELMGVLRKLNASGMTIVLIEHRMSAVMSLSDLVLVLNFGRRIAMGTPDEIRRDQSVIDAYLGTRRAS
ncbi:MAG: ABC transporter ATP-binding protein [Betaproteobacteria bacterium]|nr:MAG: ABC transporter ATP-binding protein [Betaproteobacteria bacterium]